MTDTEAALLRAVCVEPGSDLPRLILADYWDDHGQPDRAEFTRVQCRRAAIEPEVFRFVCGGPGPIPNPLVQEHAALGRRAEELFDSYPVTWLFNFDGSERWRLSLNASITGTSPVAVVRRGFPAEIRLPLARLVGGPCGRCEPTMEGRRSGYIGDSDPTRWSIGDRGPEYLGAAPCPDCSGTGRTPGVAPALFAAHPVERVTLTNVGPDRIGDEWVWVRSRPGLDDFASTLPADLFDVLTEGVAEDSVPECVESGSAPDYWRVYPTEAAARDAASAACCDYGRHLAGLPPLEVAAPATA